MAPVGTPTNKQDPTATPSPPLSPIFTRPEDHEHTFQEDYPFTSMQQDTTTPLPAPAPSKQTAVRRSKRLASKIQPRYNLEIEEIDEEMEEASEGEDNIEWEVEEIVQYREQIPDRAPIPAQKHYYLVKWAGYPHSRNTWEHWSDLSNARNAIHDFHNRMMNTGVPTSYFPGDYEKRVPRWYQ
jgi:hypothetical protein